MPENITQIPASRVPLTEANGGMVTREWYRFFQNLFNLTGAGNNNISLSDLQVSPPAYDVALFSAPRYGTFYDTTTQTAAATGTAYAMTFNTTDLSYGVELGTPTSRVYVRSEGIFNIQFSAQLNKASAAIGNVYIWFRINGVDQANSATQVSLSGSNAASVAAWNFVYKFKSGDYFELMWSTSDTGCQIQAATASGVVPGIPSIILTVTDNISA